MTALSRFACLAAALPTLLVAPVSPALDPVPPAERRLPPPGIGIPAELRAALEPRLERFFEDVWGAGHHPRAADAEAPAQAVRLALVHGEIYDEKELPLLEELLELAEERLARLKEGESPWTEERGLAARGYRSRVDGSVQPYGLEIPETLDLSRPVPLLVWLHGRGDKATDLHFIKRCLSRSQALGGLVAGQQDAIIVHPHGRHCVGWKHAGEIDVFEAIEDVKRQFPVDPDRVALAGFSMGGAGAWHIGARHADQFCAVHAGAGFAETARYNNLSPESGNWPPETERLLWRLYDAPGYVRNLFNLPVLAYSGELDKQKQAADLMAEAFAAEGRELEHVIGQGMEHKYDQVSADRIWEWLRGCWAEGRPAAPSRLHLQTTTPRHGRMHWIQAIGQEIPWEDTRVEAAWDAAAGKITLETRNVSALRVEAPGGGDLGGTSLLVDGQSLAVESPGFPVHAVELHRAEGGWTWGESAGLRKRTGSQGPIDDAFLDPFVVAGPVSPSPEPLAERWVAHELSRFRDRWRALMRGELPEKRPDEVNADDVAEKNLVLWGEPATNPLIAEIADRLPVQWKDGEIRFGGQSWPAAGHVPAFIFPNPLNPRRYVVINSGLTFREAHDRTNSQQNPKLGDWAIIGLDQLPDAEAPGRVAAQGIFSETWDIQGSP